MDELKLLYEFEDRHAENLVYEGAYQLSPLRLDETLVNLFNDWRQRVYRFDNNAGASVVLYTPVNSQIMTWDLVLTSFFGEQAFDFKQLNVLRPNLHWRDVQRLLDNIKANRL